MVFADLIPALFELTARGRSKEEGVRLAERLLDLGLELLAVPLDMEAGALAVAELINSAQLRVSRTAERWLAAYRQYRRDGEGRLVEQNDHIMRATALLALYGRDVAIPEIPIEIDYAEARVSGRWSTGY